MLECFSLTYTKDTKKKKNTQKPTKYKYNQEIIIIISLQRITARHRPPPRKPRRTVLDHLHSPTAWSQANQPREKVDKFTVIVMGILTISLNLLSRCRSLSQQEATAQAQEVSRGQVGSTIFVVDGQLYALNEFVLVF